MNEKKYIKSYQRIVATASFAIILILAFLWVSSFSAEEWKKHQNDYLEISQRIADSIGLAEAMLPEKGIYEVSLPQFNRVDRCISCHNGLENPLMKNAPQPHTFHPAGFLDQHPIADFGCTICHGGQGRAMNKEEAFGLEDSWHWPEPVLYQPYIQASCGKCHLAVFDQKSSFEGTDVFFHGQQLFADEGCLGCHKARGVGGLIGPDLTEQGEKTRHEYNFRNIEGDQSVSNWLKEHFVDPEMVSPGSQMLKIDLPEEELNALATFVMGLSKPDIPLDYFSLEMLEELKGVRKSLSGNEIFSFTCSACHGKQGEGKDYESYATGVPAVMNPDFLRLASSQFIHFTILKGRSQKQMASWDSGLSGFKNQEIEFLKDVLKSGVKYSWSTPVYHPNTGNIKSGRLIFDENCASCHGENGRGGLAVTLNQKDFLARASDSFILKTLEQGRENTAMPAWPEFTEFEIRDLFSLIRSWYTGPASTPVMKLSEPDLSQGEIQYHYNCSRCHGVNGEGNTGPSIINRNLLTAASDYYLYKTISEGRNHTSMFGWSKDLNKQEALNQQDISNIIGFIKEKAGEKPDYVFPGSNPGNPAAGKKLFVSHCAECHGEKGEGLIAPGLNNQEFLSAASNGFILATITLGRKNTQMPSWGYDNVEYVTLSDKERQDIVAYIRAWQRLQIGF